MVGYLMLNYIIGRLLRMIPQLFLISILAFIIIQLPPGDFLSEQINRLRFHWCDRGPGPENADQFIRS